jgi:hypothetical protein
MLTILMTFPLVTDMGRLLRDRRDSYLNTWIIARNTRCLASLDLEHYFDANIFYPYTSTLAYSEHMLPQSLVALVLSSGVDNPVLVHNILLVLSFLCAGLCMYLYSRYLTKSWAAGIVAGIIFAFSPFMMSHLSHLQVLATCGIPLAFLFLLRFTAGERWSDLIALALVLALQMLANGYYALYISFFLGTMLLYHSLISRRILSPAFLTKLAVLGLLVAMLAGPFLLTYVTVQEEMGFRRARQNLNHARPGDFLVTPPYNNLYGKPKVNQGERSLFPGATAVALAILGLAGRPRRTRSRDTEQHLHDRQVHRERSRSLLRLVPRALWRTSGDVTRAPDGRAGGASRLKASPCCTPEGPGADRTDEAAPSALRYVRRGVPIVAGALLVATVVIGGLELSIWVVLGLLLLVLVLGATSAMLERDRQGRTLMPLDAPEVWPRMHLWILGIAFLCSFGTSIWGPYMLLYELVPGFDGLRAVPRIHVFTMLALAALASFGLERLLRQCRPWLVPAIAVVAPVLLVAEYLSVPIPLQQVPVGGSVPAVYRWLATQQDCFPVLELPLPPPHGNVAAVECSRVYFSTVHWKPLVNGYSGYFPPLYNQLRRRWAHAPALSNLEDARRLGVRYLVVHREQLEHDRLTRLHAALESLGEEARRSWTDGKDEVWSLRPLPCAGTDPLRRH